MRLLGTKTNQSILNINSRKWSTIYRCPVSAKPICKPSISTIFNFLLAQRPKKVNCSYLYVQKTLGKYIYFSNVNCSRSLPSQKKWMKIKIWETKNMVDSSLGHSQGVFINCPETLQENRCLNLYHACHRKWMLSVDFGDCFDFSISMQLRESIYPLALT